MPANYIFRPPFTKRGQNWLPLSRPLLRGDVTGSGSVEIGGSATYSFNHAPQTDSNIVVEWDFDNDGDFGSAVEDITEYVLSVETQTGRDWPSLLTGKAGPGKLRASLKNSDDRFSYFNTASPLNMAPFSLKTGRKVRVRTTSATSPDPALLAKDRFRRTNGPLGSEEGSLAYVEPLANDFTIEANAAVATNDGNEHIAVIDTGSADYYVQAQISVLGLTSNRVGIIYRYVDSSNYSALLVDAADSSLQLIDVVAGVVSGVAAQEIETYSGITIGVLVESAVVTAYLEGVALLTGTAIQTSAEYVGIYANWMVGDSRPEIDNLFVWDGLTAEVEGILWTGDVSDLVSSVSAGPEKNAVVQGDGWLSKLATQDVTPPTSIVGRKTGLLVGNVLAGSMLLNPPGSIDLGDVTTGAFAMSSTDAMEIARRVEETEFGFLYETQEGPISFLARSARDSATSQVTFTDDPNGVFHYHRLEPYDWKKEVFNRVVAGVSPWVIGLEDVLYTDPGPYILTAGQTQTIQASYDGVVVEWTGHTRDIEAPGGNPGGISITTDTEYATTFTVNLPGSIVAGELLLIIVGLFPDVSSTRWNGTVPSGWSELASSNVYDYGGDIVLAKVAAGTEDGTTISLGLTGSGSASWVAHIYQVGDWQGTLDGVSVTGWTGGSGANPNPPTITPPWGSLPTLYVPFYVIPYTRTQTGIPTGYGDGTFEAQLASAVADVGVGSASRVASVSSENPDSFSLSSSVNQWRARTIAIQGPTAITPVTGDSPAGNNPTFTISYDAGIGGVSQSHSNIQVTGVPLTEGAQQSVQVDDYDSQDDHNSIRTYQNAANLFANAADAETYADLVLGTHADDRPILSMSFYASKSPAYRAQAIRRRVNDKITLIATNNAGLGISQDFFIESINHRLSQGNKLWEVTWELSPA